MSAARVVPALDPGEEGRARLGLALPASAVDQLAFQAGEEALGHRVVVVVADGAHRRVHAHLLAAATEGNAGVLAALVGVMDDRVRFARVQRRVQCRQHQIDCHALAHGPATTLRLNASITTAK